MPSHPSKIHASAIIHAAAKLDPSVEVGPYCLVGPGVQIGAGTRLLSHVVIEGSTSIGAQNVLYPGVCIGFPAQSLSVSKSSRIVIGDDNIFREHVTVHTGLKDAGTVIGNRNYFMASSHAGHDSQVANEVTLANSAALGGHVVVEDGVVIGGLCGIHQFCRIGKFSMVGGVTKVTQDVLPFTLVDGRPTRLSGVNVVGLKRRGYSRQTIGELRRAVRLILYSGAKIKDVLDSLSVEFSANKDIEHLIHFARASKRGLVRRGEQETSP